MTEKYTPSTNKEDVLQYYSRSEEKGYWGFLKGRCHYGYSSENDPQPFNMESAQLEMERLLGKMLNLPPGSTVLDAGSGYGPVARTLAKEFDYRVSGIDLIPMRLQKAVQLNQEEGISTVNFFNADYHSLPFADNSFDGVYTMETLVHAEAFEVVLAEFHRVLKPGGKIVLFEYSIPDINSDPGILQKMATRVIKNTGMASLPHFTHGSFHQILHTAGFIDVKAEDISSHVYDSWFHLWKFALRFTLEEFIQGRIGFDHIPGSMWIWPARHRLGYNICQATKPML